LDQNSAREGKASFLRPLRAIVGIFAEGSKLLCPRRPPAPIAFWVRVWVSEFHHSAKVGVLGTFESDSFLEAIIKVFPTETPLPLGE